MKLVGYLRGPNYKDQANEIEEWLKSDDAFGENPDIQKFYLDKDGPGSRISSRKSYQKMLDEHSEWDCLVVSSLETLHTDIQNMFNFLAFLLAYKKTIYSVKEGIPFTGFLRGAYSLKEIYDTDTGNYVPRVTAQKAHLDTWIGRPPYGYRIMKLDNDRKVLAPREAESLVVKLIFKLRAKGASYSAIANELNSKGIPATRKGKRWTFRKVMRILDNKVYWGYREIYNDMGDRTWVRHNYPPIVDENLGQKAYRMRAVKKERKK